MFTIHNEADVSCVVIIEYMRVQLLSQWRQLASTYLSFYIITVVMFSENSHSYLIQYERYTL